MNTVTEKNRESEKIGVESLWEFKTSDVYMLVCIDADMGKVVLLSLKYAEPGCLDLCVKDPRNLTKIEWGELTKNMPSLTRIYHVEIKTERGGE